LPTADYPLPTAGYPLPASHCILIVDDDSMSTLLLQKNLKGEKIAILYAENGWEAVELVRHHPEINLVLMDIKMPVMNGFEATRLIKQQRPELPVIAQSAFTSKEERQKARDAGCDNFITKPINKTELLEMVRVLLKR
jgi:CheY-like chemotaxis protein